MHMLYNSENFAVMQHMGDGHPHGGFEIVDKRPRGARSIWRACWPSISGRASSG